MQSIYFILLCAYGNDCMIESHLLTSSWHGIFSSLLAHSRFFKKHSNTFLLRLWFIWLFAMCHCSMYATGYKKQKLEYVALINECWACAIRTYSANRRLEFIPFAERCHSDGNGLLTWDSDDKKIKFTWVSSRYLLLRSRYNGEMRTEILYTLT